jgi:CheY-like chemotaxis protein
MTDDSKVPSPTILVAEDEAMLRLVAVEVLTDAGFEVLEAADGMAALKILQADQGKIGLVISDVKMPGLNGYQLVEAGQTLHPRLKFMLMTGYAQDPLPPALAKAGIRVLYKPFDFDRLPALAHELLER